MADSFLRTFYLLVLFLFCTFLWLLQSLPTLNQFLDEGGGEVTRHKEIVLEQARLPGIVICNDLPYTQSGLNNFGKGVNQDALRQYLNLWLNPAAIDSPDYESMSDDDQKVAEATISQILPNAGLKQRLDQILLKCQDFVSSCVIQGVTKSGFECCENVEPFLATLNGICWIFRNKTFMQNLIDGRFGIQITFQTTHPGLSIFLVSNDEYNDRVFIATQLSTPNFHLKDKRQHKILIRKQIETNLRRNDCTNQYYTATKMSNFTFAPCLVEASVQQCACVPLVAVLWTLQGDLDISFLRRFDVSTICTVEEYNRCAGKYIIQSQPSRWSSAHLIPGYQPLKNSIDYCQRTTRMPCQHTTFKTTQSEENDLPPEYRNTQDFVSRFSIAYDSLDATEIIEDRSVDLRAALTTIGYNLATWFAIGHLIWSFWNWFISSIDRSNHKIQPRESLIISQPIQIRSRQQLPPLEIQNHCGTIPEAKTLYNGNPRPLPRHVIIDNPSDSSNNNG